MLWSCLPKIEECGPRPSSLWTSNWTQAPRGAFLRQLLQVQSPKKIFCHSNIPTWRQASALLLLQSCFYALFIQNFCSVCYSVFYVCCLNLDSVLFHSEFCLASSTFLKSLLSMISFSF